MADTVSVLNHRAVLSVTGVDRHRFLDGLVSCDVAKMAPGEVAYGALLTPQGKIVADILAFCEAERMALDVPAAAADDLVRRLTLYKLRAAVAVERTDEAVVIGAGTADPRSRALPLRGIAAAGEAGEVADLLDEYTRARIVTGIPEADLDFGLGEAFPHDVNMDVTGGVDFAKGCFVGQEVVSRMRHRGTARRRTVIVEGNEPLPESGTALTVADKPVGQLGTVLDREGLALVRIDRVAEVARAGEVSVRLRVPHGAPFALAASEPAT